MNTNAKICQKRFISQKHKTLNALLGIKNGPIVKQRGINP